MMTGAIILAAGESSRMGRSKQALPVDGQPLLVRTVTVVQEANVRDIMVVLGAREEEHRRLLGGTDVLTVYNADWKKGMGTSIRVGLQAIVSMRPEVTTVLVLVCDQPLLTAELITTMINRFRGSGKSIVACRYDGLPGVPALFDSRHFAGLIKLPDDQGAKKLILQQADDVELIDFPGGETDLDTMKDYETFLRTSR